MSEVNKAQHYGTFQKQDDKRNRLAMKTAYKALDMTEDEMQITSTKSGIGALGAIGIALAAGLGPAALAAAMILPGLVGSKPGAAPVQPAPVVAQPPALGSQAFDEIVEEKQADGSWKEVDRQPFGTFPKGPKP